MDARDIIIKPVISEKSLADVSEGRYTFVVHVKANKTQIKKAIEEIFKVEVEKVNTVRVRGKLRRMGRTQGYTASWKKAVVVLKPGQRIKQFFDDIS